MFLRQRKKSSVVETFLFIEASVQEGEIGESVKLMKEKNCFQLYNVASSMFFSAIAGNFIAGRL